MSVFKQELRNFLKFATLRGSQVHPDQISVPLAGRMRGRPFAVMSIGVQGTRVGKMRITRKGVELNDIVFHPREVRDGRDASPVVPTEAFASARERSPSGFLVVGLAVQVSAKSVEYSSEMVAKVQADQRGIEDGTDRVALLWNERSQKMVRYAANAAFLRGLEARAAEFGLKINRLDLLPQVLMNALLGHPACDAMNANDGKVYVRIPTVIDANTIQALCVKPDSTWTVLRMSPTAASRDRQAEVLRQFLVSLHRQVAPTGDIELSILDASSTEEVWKDFEEATQALNKSQDLSSAIVLNRVMAHNNIDLYALALHP